LCVTYCALHNRVPTQITPAIDYKLYKPKHGSTQRRYNTCEHVHATH
jgi:hypothetical protein